MESGQGMSEEAPVVPIRPGAQIRAERAAQLVEHLAERIASFAHDNGEEAEDIAFAIIGKEGTIRIDWLISSRWRSTLALAAVLLAAAAAKPSEKVQPPLSPPAA